MNRIISLQAGVVGDVGRQFGRPVDFELCEGEHIAVIGPNGGGKTILMQMVTGRLFLRSGAIEFTFRGGAVSQSENIRYVTFNDAYGTGEYYQQRWNSSDRDAMPKVSEHFDGIMPRGGAFDSLGLDEMWHKRIVMLSTGELRKLCIARMLIGSPQVLILENPYIGLDSTSRQLFSDLLSDLSRHGSLSIIMVVTSADDIPEFITHVYEVSNMVCNPKCTRVEFLSSKTFDRQKEYDIKLPYADSTECTDNEIIGMHNVTVRYGERVILDRLNWTVMCGEKWSLSGANGSGKSTLLSLVCADNPQGYSQDMSLFGRKRGTGESIWDIKRRIGYVSPEMHGSYVKNIPAIEIVASGFFDTIGLYRQPSAEQIAQCEAWLTLFGIEHLRDKSFVKLSFGEQRMLLLARAFVKNPDLLILDEPMHGLDPQNKQRAKAIVEAFAAQPSKTLIYVTHYSQELPECINRNLCLRKK